MTGKDGKTELFCLEYMRDLNGRQAAIRAGYSPATAAAQASRLLKNDKVLIRVKELIKKRNEELCLDANSVVLRLIDIYEKCMTVKPPLARGQETKETPPGGGFVFDIKGALRAAELLGKHLGMFSDKPEPPGALNIAGELSAARRRAEGVQK